jgi:sigma-B regulation protein RsbU (phosphoserine phosphatase)
LTELREITIYGVLEPAEDIGGDLYDAFMIDDRFLCFAIADVFGKGIVASMMMTMVQTLIRSQSRYSSSAVSLMKEVNSYLCLNNKQGNFITLIVGILDLKTGVVEFCNAGHTPIYMKKANQQCIRFGETHTTALGMFQDLKLESSIIPLDVNDMLVLFTDGVTEAMNEEEHFFGLERLEEIISTMQNPNPEGMAKTILQEVRNFTGQAKQSDDLSLLVLKFNHPRS